ncbi:MAG: cyclic nucleotide-binding domain-containing protein [Thermoanaerobaculia bacterium]
MDPVAIAAWWINPLRNGLVLLVAAAILFLVARVERPRVLRALAFYVGALALHSGAALAQYYGLAELSRTVRFLALVLSGIAFINVAAIAAFSILRKFRYETPRIVRDLVLAAAYIVLLIHLFSQSRVDITGIIATSAVLTAIIGFSLQDVLSNIMGGLALQLDKSIVPGVWIRYGDTAGIVREISWRFTSIETRNGDILVVPNGVLVKNPVLVLGRPLGGGVRERRWVFFNVGYQHSPRTVIETVTDALRREPIVDVAPEPLPDCQLMDFQESSCRYAVRYWLTNLQRDDPTDSVVRTRVFFALQRAEIPFAVPTARREHQQSPPPDPEELARTQKLRLDAFARVPLFRSLTPDELATITERLVETPFVAGEAVFLQGSSAHHLYILVSGNVEVRVSVEGAPPTVVARLSAPNFFGEMGLLTGEPRRATIVATTDVQCLRLGKDDFQEIIQERPEIADEISHVLAERSVELEAIRDGLSEEAKRLRIASTRGTLLARIQKFFDLDAS